MKSIMQEASSVIKAIEKGWETAGKPKEFSVRVFEEPKKNFLGMTVQSAKIGIFFDEKKGEHLSKQEKSAPKQEVMPKKITPTQHKPQTKDSIHIKKSEPEKPYSPKPEKSKLSPISLKQEKVERTIWSEEMIQAVQEWLTDIFKAMDIKHIPFTLEAANYHLKVTFETLITTDHARDQQLIRSFSVLIMQTLRHKFKRPLRGFKIILTHAS